MPLKKSWSAASSVQSLESIGDGAIPPQKRSWVDLLKVLHCAFGYLVIHIAYAPVQNVVTTAKGNIGFVALSLLSFVFGFCALLAPSIQQRIGLRTSIVIGASGYALFIVSCIPDEGLFALLGAFAIGFGASAIWNGQAVYVSRNSGPETIGLYNGLFFSLFQFNGILGNATAAWLKSADFSYPMLFFICSLVGVVGVLILAVLRPPSYTPPHTHRVTLKMAFRGVFKAFRDMKWFVCLLFAMGIKGAFMIGKLPLVMQDIGSDASIALYGFACYAISNVIASAANGKLFDKFGWKILVGNITVAWTSIVGLLIMAEITKQTFIFFIIFCCFGVLDSSDNLLVCALVPKLWKDDVSTYLSVYRFVTPVSSAIAYLYGPLIPGWIIEACMITGFMYVGLAIFVYGTRTFPSEETVKEYDVLERQSSELEEMHYPTQMEHNEFEKDNYLNDEEFENNELGDGEIAHPNSSSMALKPIDLNEIS